MRNKLALGPEIYYNSILGHRLAIRSEYVPAFSGSKINVYHADNLCHGQCSCFDCGQSISAMASEKHAV